MVQTIYLILGVSRSGKDTAAGFIKELVPDVTPLKFSTPVKRDYERRYGLPEGALELDPYRNSRVPGSDKTYLEHLVEDFDRRAGYYLEKKLAYLQSFHSARSVVVTDCRMPEELEMLQSMFPSSKLEVLYLTADRAKPQPSDHYLDRMVKTLLGNPVYAYRNNGTLEDLKEAVHYFIRSSQVPTLTTV